jgi:hypothetical protein
MKTKKIVLAALLIALSFIGANIKIMGSIAFDSMPGFLGALILSPLLIPVLGKTVLIGMVPALSAVAALNIIMAQVIHKILPERYKSWK